MFSRESRQSDNSILFFSVRLSEYGGTIRRLKIWFKNFPRNINAVYMYATPFGRDPERILFEERENNVRKIKYSNFNASNPGIILRLRAGVALANELVKNRYETVMPVQFDSDVIAFFVVKIFNLFHSHKVRIVCYCAGGQAKVYMDAMGWRGIKVWLYGNALKIVYRKADKILAVSQQMKTAIVLDYGVHKDNIDVVPISVVCCNYNLPEFYFERSDNQVPVFGCLSRFSIEKCLDHVIKAFSNFLKSGNARLLMFGDGPERLAIERLVTDLNIDDKVEFHGWLANSKDAIELIDCLVMASKHEGTPRSILEAGCLGVPTIASCVGGIPDIVKDGSTGWLYSHGDIETLCRLMHHVVENPKERARVGLNMRAYVRATHNSETEVKHLISALLPGA